MKAKLTIYFYVALLPAIIYGEDSIIECLNDVTKIAKEEGRINNIFQPTSDQPLGDGSYSFTFGGTLFPSERNIAMKFTRSQNRSVAEKEYEMYSYLDAINNEDVERYGIPSVYYYGKWDKHNVIMMGITLLDHNIDDLQEKTNIFKEDVNVLIVLRDFILASKYIHSRGVRHDDVKVANMMVRNHRSFLIDFNMSSKMNRRNLGGTVAFVSKNAHTYGERYAKDDWESFLYSICYSIGTIFEWIGIGEITRAYELKSNTRAVMKKIKKIRSETLKSILVEFAEHIFDDGEQDGGSFYDASNTKRFPDYDYFYKLVDNKIRQSNLSEVVMFTWLTKEQRDEANVDLNEHRIPDITQIKDPKEFDFSKMKYPKAISSMKASSSASNSKSRDKSRKKYKQKTCCFACESSEDETIDETTD